MVSSSALQYPASHGQINNNKTRLKRRVQISKKHLLNVVSVQGKTNSITWRHSRDLLLSPPHLHCLVKSNTMTETTKQTGQRSILSPFQATCIRVLAHAKTRLDLFISQVKSSPEIVAVIKLGRQKVSMESRLVSCCCVIPL